MTNISEGSPTEADSDVALSRPVPDIQRLSSPASEAGLLIYEAFNVRMRITPEMKGAFLKDTARFMAQFFEQRGHKVNGFQVTVTADNRMRKTVEASHGEVELSEIVVHVVQGGVSNTLPPPTAHGVSNYI